MSDILSILNELFKSLLLRRNTQIAELEKSKVLLTQKIFEEQLLPTRQMTLEEYCMAKNCLEIAKRANPHYKEIKSSQTNEQVQAQEKPDIDWCFRFFDAAKNVSNEDMQTIWAKILAGEFAHPSTYSLKTLDVLSYMSKQDAELFTKVYSHSFLGTHNIYLPNETEYREAVGIKISEILKLNELGLISDNGNLSMTFDISSEPQGLFRTQNLFILMSSMSGNLEHVQLRMYPFTGAGRELSKLLSESASDEDLMKYGRLLSQNKKYKISVHKIITRRDGDEISYDKTNLLDAEEKQ